MAVQTVVIDVFQTNQKLKEFDKNVDRLGKSFEKMRKQMERFNQDKRSTGLSLSQGDMFSKSVDKMTNTMTKLFSNGIKINNPTVNAKVTVDFAKMDLAGQMGSALKNADIAGTILRNLRLPKMGISNASAFKVDIPNKMQVEITNKELQVKLPKEPSQGKKQGFLTGSREKFDEARGKYVTKQYRKNTTNSFQKSTIENIEKNTTEGISKGLPRVFNKAKDGISKIFTGFKGFFSGKKEKILQDSSSTGKILKPKKTYHVNKSWGKEHIKGSFERGIEEKTGNFVKNMNFLGRVIPDSFNSLKSLPRIFGGMKTAFSGLSLGGKVGGIATAGISIFSIALKGLTGAIKGAAGIIKGVIGIFQNIASVVSSVWGQVQKWAINPLVNAQNQMSVSKGYWDLLGGEEGAIMFENEINSMSTKMPFSHDAVISASQKFLEAGMGDELTRTTLLRAADVAAAKSLDDTGFMQIVDSLIQIKSSPYVNLQDITQGLAGANGLKTIARGYLGKKDVTPEEIKEVEKILSEGIESNEKSISGEAMIGYFNKGAEIFAGTAKEIASETYGGLLTKIKNIFQSDIVRKWGGGLSEGLTDGFSGFAQWLDDNRQKFIIWGEQLKKIGKEIGEHITTILQNLGERMNRVFNSSEFKQADLSGKIVIFWDEVIKKPFSNWWESTGRSFFHTTFENLGETTGGILSGVINGFLGSNPEDGVGEGYSLGFKFAQGFMKGFDAGGVIANIGKALLKISWDYSLGLIVNPIIKWAKNLMNGGGEKKVLPDSQYNELKNGLEAPKLEKRTYDRYDYQVLGDGYATNLVVQESAPDAFTTYAYTKEDTARAQKWAKEYTDYEMLKKGIADAQEIEYGRAQITKYDTVNGSLDTLYKQANDATWEYNHNAMLKEEAEKAGDTDKALIAQLKMDEAQSSLNSAIWEMNNIYPGIIENESLALDIIKERLDNQKKINEEMKRGKLIELENTLAAKEDLVDSNKQLAMGYKKTLDETTKEVVDFNNNANGFVNDFRDWGGLQQKSDNMKKDKSISKEEKERAEGEAKASEQALRDRLLAMNFTDDEINKAFKEEKKNGYTGEVINDMIKLKGDELNTKLQEAQTLYETAKAALQEVLLAKQEITKNQVEDIIGGPLEQMTEAQWKGLSDDDRQKVLGLIGDVDNLALKLKDLGLEPIDIFLNIKTIGGVTPEGGENGQPTGQGATTVKTGAGGVQETVNQLLTALGVKKEATGDILTSPHMALVAEAGPEAIIPLSKGRRARGLELWEKAGQMMGVYPHADGGVFGSFTVPRQTPHLYQQIEESREESESAGGQISQIDIGGVYLGGVNFTFNGTEANSREGIMKVIKEQMPDIADEIAGTIAVNIQRIFANMKLQTS